MKPAARLPRRTERDVQRRAIRPPEAPVAIPPNAFSLTRHRAAARYHRPMLARGLVVALCLVPLVAAAQESRHARPVTAAPARPAATAESDALLRQIADAQRSLGEELQGIQERLEALHNDIAASQDHDDAVDDDVKALRDEVKGLYVEDSTLKQQIDSLREDIDGVNSNVSGFRTFSGFFLAVMIMLLAVIFVLTIRR